MTYRLIGQDGIVFANGPGETWIQSHISSYQRLYKWYLIPPCLTFSNKRYISRVKWRNLRKGVALSVHLSVVAIENGAFGSHSTMVANFSTLFKFLKMFNCFFSELTEDIFLLHIGWLVFKAHQPMPNPIYT